MFEHKHEWKIFRAKFFRANPTSNFLTIIDNASVHGFSVVLNHKPKKLSHFTLACNSSNDQMPN